MNNNNNKDNNYGTVHLYQTGEEVRPATKDELIYSLEAAEQDGGAGVYYDPDTGCLIYVTGSDLFDALTALRQEALAAGDTEQADLCLLALKDDCDSLIECLRAMQD